MIASSTTRSSTEEVTSEVFVIDGNLVLAGLHISIDSHGAKPSVGGTGDEAESSQLVLVLPLGLIIARRRRRVVIGGVIVEDAEGDEEGMLCALAFLRYIFLSTSLSNPPFHLYLTKDYSCLSLLLPEKCLFFLGQWVTKWSRSP
jgi:hypothetical protein